MKLAVCEKAMMKKGALRRRLRAHGEAEREDREIEWPATDAQKCPDCTGSKADSGLHGSSFYMKALDGILLQRIGKDDGAEGDQDGRLDSSHQLGVREYA